MSEKVFVALSKLALILWCSGLAFYSAANWGSFVASDVLVLSVVVMAGLAVLWVLIDLTRSRGEQVQTSLVICSGFFAIYTFEAFHLGWKYYPGFPDYSPPIHIDQKVLQEAQEAEVFLDKRNTYEVVRDFRGRGVDAMPAFMVADRESWQIQALESGKVWPLGGISRKFIVHCNESGYWGTYSSDEKGFNNPLGVWELQSSEPIDLLLLGDSFVHGACVRAGDDYGGQFRRMGYRVINLGQRGNGPILQLAGLKEYGERVKPRIVLWFYLENNDLINLRAEASNEFLKKYLGGGFSQNLANRVEEIDQVIEAEINTHWGKIQELSQLSTLDIFRFWVTLRMLRKRIGFEVYSGSDSGTEKFKRAKALIKQGQSNLDKDESEEQPSRKVQSKDEYSDEIELLSDIVSEARNIASGWKSQFIFVYLSGADRLNGRIEGPFRAKDAVLAAMQDIGVTVIDVAPGLEALDDPLRVFPFRGRGHYDALGYGTTPSSCAVN